MIHVADLNLPFGVGGGPFQFQEAPVPADLVYIGGYLLGVGVISEDSPGGPKAYSRIVFAETAKGDSIAGLEVEAAGRRLLSRPVRMYSK